MADVVAMIRNPQTVSDKKRDILTSIKDKLYSNLIEEDRYKLIFKGMTTTLVITALSILFGTICGLIMYLLAYKYPGSVKYIFDKYALWYPSVALDSFSREEIFLLFLTLAQIQSLQVV